MTYPAFWRQIQPKLGHLPAKVIIEQCIKKQRRSLVTLEDIFVLPKAKRVNNLHGKKKIINRWREHFNKVLFFLPLLVICSLRLDWHSLTWISMPNPFECWRLKSQQKLKIKSCRRCQPTAWILNYGATVIMKSLHEILNQMWET